MYTITFQICEILDFFLMPFSMCSIKNCSFPLWLINIILMSILFCQHTIYCKLFKGARVAQWVRSLDLATRTSLSPIRHGFAPSFVNYNQRLPGACNLSPGSKLLSITTQLQCGGHLGGWARLPDTILEEDHPMTIPSKFGSNWATGSRQDGFYVNFP